MCFQNSLLVIEEAYIGQDQKTSVLNSASYVAYNHEQIH